MPPKFVTSRLLAIALSALAIYAHATEPEAAADAALYRAAMLHRGGDTPAALDIWRGWAKRGNLDAAYNLAVVHQHADGVTYDPAEAARWYRYAAERGDRGSQFQLGLMYQNGEGMPADPVQAHEWFTRNRREHAHHHHNDQYRQWQQQASALIDERDRREAAIASRRDGIKSDSDTASVAKLAAARQNRLE